MGASYFRILKKFFLKYELKNYGKNGDTVVSLYNRMKKIKLEKNYDLAFIWIGTNDVLVKVSWTYPILKATTNQNWAKSDEEFVDYYKKIINQICCNVKKIIVVTPIFIGENINNRWNKELDHQAEIIRKISKCSKKVKFLDLRKNFYPKLENKEVSGYIAKTSTSVILDFLQNRTIEDVDRTSKKRGLYFTIDGIHLNSTGAKIVADEFKEYIKKL